MTAAYGEVPGWAPGKPRLRPGQLILMVWAWGWGGGKQLVTDSYAEAKRRQAEEQEKRQAKKAAKKAEKSADAGQTAP